MPRVLKYPESIYLEYENATNLIGKLPSGLGEYGDAAELQKLIGVDEVSWPETCS